MKLIFTRSQYCIGPFQLLWKWIISNITIIFYQWNLEKLRTGWKAGDLVYVGHYPLPEFESARCGDVCKVKLQSFFSLESHLVSTGTMIVPFFSVIFPFQRRCFLYLRPQKCTVWSNMDKWNIGCSFITKTHYMNNMEFCTVNMHYGVYSELTSKNVELQC